MNLPRWTVYPALALLAGTIAMAIPRGTTEDPYSGEAKARASINASGFKHAPVVVLGIDGLDPDILEEVVELYPERMKNFRWLIAQASGIKPLGTSNPPQSPVAWSNFITGLDPGGHGVFDFIHRDTMTRGPATSTTTVPKSFDVSLPGSWHFAVPMGGGESNRSGESFWSIMAEEGVPADIWRMPANFPVEPSLGLSFPGMMTPALDSAYGQCSILTSNSFTKSELQLHYKEKGKVALLQEVGGGKYLGSLSGPPHPYFVYGSTDLHAEVVPLTVHVDTESEAAVIDTGAEKVVLQPGQWSDFLRVDFKMLPLGLETQSGICRFFLRSIEPDVEIYVSPINLDPEQPGVSEPSSASADLVEGIGRYYTQGMAEDVNALKNNVLTDAEFMGQVELVYEERKDMLDYALDHYLEDDEGGLLFFYFSTVDLSCHMMWRHHDTSHPAHDPKIAAQDSSDWSGREGSTWSATVHDLYMKMDPVLGRIRERLGDEVTLIVMSDHGFAPYRRMFNLNTWLVEEGYLALQPGKNPEPARGDANFEQVRIYSPGVVDWSKTRAYGMGFNALYLNLEGRELDDPETDEDESGIVAVSEKRALLAEIQAKLEAYVDPETGLNAILQCYFAEDVYSGDRMSEAPDMLVGFNAGYGNSDAASLGRIPHEIIEDNSPETYHGKLGTFNGSHLMAPEVVAGTLLSNRPVLEGEHKLEDLTVEILELYGIEKPDAMKGHPVLE